MSGAPRRGHWLPQRDGGEEALVGCLAATSLIRGLSAGQKLPASTAEFNTDVDIFRMHPFPPPAVGWLPPTRSGCPVPIQPGLESLQRWGIHSLSGQPVPAPHHSHSKELKSTNGQE